jgi:ribosomal protein L37AE/L43A
VSIIKKTIWTARCDRCKKKFGEGAMFPFATSKKQLLKGFEDALWEIQGGTVLCDECSYIEE